MTKSLQKLWQQTLKQDPSNAKRLQYIAKMLQLSPRELGVLKGCLKDRQIDLDNLLQGFLNAPAAKDLFFVRLRATLKMAAAPWPKQRIKSSRNIARLKRCFKKTK